MDTPKRKYTDPLGRPLEQGSPSFTDQQAGGDLTGRETDPRDDNFSSDAKGQLTRDMSSGPDSLPGTHPTCCVNNRLCRRQQRRKGARYP